MGDSLSVLPLFSTQFLPDPIQMKLDAPNSQCAQICNKYFIGGVVGSLTNTYDS